jgi:ribosomal protein S18 acetylase RimI-like enzyme
LQMTELYVDASPMLEIGTPEPCDLDRIVAVASAASVFSDEELDVVRELVQEHFAHGANQSGYYFVIAGDAQDLLGFACYGPRPLTQGTFDLYWIVVAPGAGRRRIGSALLSHVIEDVRRLDGRLLIAETSGLPEYRPARSFYLTHGFACAATIADFYSRGDDMVLFVKRLE